MPLGRPVPTQAARSIAVAHSLLDSPRRVVESTTPLQPSPLRQVLAPRHDDNAAPSFNPRPKRQRDAAYMRAAAAKSRERKRTKLDAATARVAELEQQLAKAKAKNAEQGNVVEKAEAEERRRRRRWKRRGEKRG